MGMTDFDDELPDNLRDVARRLREERREATPLELDRIKTTAMARARARSFQPRRTSVRSRLIMALATLALVGGGTGGVIAGSSGKDKGKDDNAAGKQYKPGKGCGDKNHNHQREDECKKDNDHDGVGGGGGGNGHH